jgi:hypothetical protein
MIIIYCYRRFGDCQIQDTLRPEVSQQVSLGFKPHLGLTTRLLLLSGCYGFVDVGHPLWREDGSVTRRGHSQQYIISTFKFLPAGILRKFFVKSGENPDELQ